MTFRNAVIASLLAGVAVGWYLGHSQGLGSQTTIRRALAEEMGRNQEMLKACMDDLKNQFTPGYKSSAPLVRMEDHSVIIAMSQGQIFKTQKATDLAIMGPGFFVTFDDKGEVYTRDGRFHFQNGRLESEEGRRVLGFELNEQGQVKGKPTGLSLVMDPNTKLYGGRYTGFHFDDSGKLFGESTMTDPVTGQQTTTNTPLFRLELAWFEEPALLSRQGVTGFVPTRRSGSARYGPPGDRLGLICPGCLELANVDFYEQATAMAALRDYASLFNGFPRSAADPAGPPPMPMLRVPPPPPMDPWRLAAPDPTISKIGSER